MLHWLGHVAGLDDASGGWYLFWSGIFGDVAFLGWPIVMLRHKNCHTRGCWRIAHHPHKTCRRHSGE